MNESRKLGQTIGTVHWYDIADQTFYQATLALGQSVLVVPYLDSLKKEDLLKDPDRLFRLLEICLIPKGVSQEDHAADLHVPGKIDRKDFFLRHLTHVDLPVLIDDFFGCNLDLSVIARFREAIQGIRQEENTERGQANGPRNLTESAPSSEKAIPASAAPSLD